MTTDDDVMIDEVESADVVGGCSLSDEGVVIDDDATPDVTTGAVDNTVDDDGCVGLEVSTTAADVDVGVWADDVG